jgi:hypothetical protein
MNKFKEVLVKLIFILFLMVGVFINAKTANAKVLNKAGVKESCDSTNSLLAGNWEQHNSSELNAVLERFKKEITGT